MTSLLRRRVVLLTDGGFDRDPRYGKERCRVPARKALVEFNSQVFERELINVDTESNVVITSIFLRSRC